MADNTAHTDAIVEQSKLQVETNLKLDILIELHKDLLNKQASSERIDHFEKHVDTKFDAMERAHFVRILVWGVLCAFVFLASYAISEILDHIATYPDITGSDFITFVNLSGGAVIGAVGTATGWFLKHFRMGRLNAQN